MDAAASLRAMFRHLTLASALLAASVTAAFSAPSRIVILRGGEAADAWKLCEIGHQRAQALKYNYLGHEAAKSLFTEEAPPAFFFALTPPTAALIAPVVDSWKKPVIYYSVLPQDDEKDTAEALNVRTREAAGNILNNPALRDKTVVMVWDRAHIADTALDAKYEREAAVTLRQLFHLDILPGVPRDWPEDNHDYFWIVEFPENSNVPSKFEMVKQEFGKSFPRVPANDWGEPSGLDAASGCAAEN
ncbi:MAG TPA: hypothetical protein VMW68_09685 [Methyloceanibacter sp.]|nr:hypothetical protein [Methyloceanibacter sp.]